MEFETLLEVHVGAVGNSQEICSAKFCLELLKN